MIDGRFFDKLVSIYSSVIASADAHGSVTGVHSPKGSR